MPGGMGYGGGADEGGFDPMTGGTLIGGAVGGGLGALSYMEQRKQRKFMEAEAKKARRERKVARMQDLTMQGQAQRQASLGLLAQAAFDWGSSMR